MSAPANEPDPREIPLDEWLWAQGHLPIACLDLLPIKIGANGIEALGLILRDSPEGPGWSLAGGRIYRNESTEQAAMRQLALSFGPEARIRDRAWDRPELVCQYFTDRRPGHPFDPRQHAVALTYLVEIDGPIRPVHQALDFCWFAPDRLPAQNEMSFGQGVFLKQLLAIARAGRAQPRLER